MGFLNKIKNLFMDDEIVEVTKEVEVENQIEPPKLPTFMKDKIEREEREKAKDSVIKPEVKDEDISDRNLLKTSQDFKFPIAFDEKDFVATRRSSPKNVMNNKEVINPPKPVEKLYRDKESVDVKKFRCTPIISPVYGILDKNYRKEEVKEKDESDYEIPRGNRKVNFEEVRKKAFGTLTDDLKEGLFFEEDKTLTRETKTRMNRLEDDLLSDMRDEIEDKDISFGEASENYYDFGVNYEAPKTKAKPVVEEKIEKEEVEVIKTEEVRPTKIDIDIDINLDDKVIKHEREVKVIDYNNEEATPSKIEIKEPVEKMETITDIFEERIEDDIKEETETREEKNRELTDVISEDDVIEETTDIEVKDEDGLEEDNREKSLELTDDLFDLIDSMYEEKENE